MKGNSEEKSKDNGITLNVPERELKTSFFSKDSHTLTRQLGGAFVMNDAFKGNGYMLDNNVRPSNYISIPSSVGSSDYYLNNYSSIPTFNSPLFKQIQLEGQIGELKKEYAESIAELAKEKENTCDAIEKINALQLELKKKEQINHILPRICEEGRKKLFESEDFKELFSNAKTCNSVVLSIDIRRSTELMLKARSPELYAKFITDLSQRLSSVIILNYGVFDKFTGDGILAFFPDFYSGPDAIFYALKAAKECHLAFDQHYGTSRDCFNVFIKNIGLGIGVDYGSVSLVNNNNELTVVGIPVVYACRMSGTDAGTTLLNQPAKEIVEKLYGSQLTIVESEINIKHEGVAVAYIVDVNYKALNIEKPDWDRLITQSKL